MLNSGVRNRAIHGSRIVYWGGGRMLWVLDLIMEQEIVGSRDEGSRDVSNG
jgi:hypothetical protein